MHWCEYGFGFGKEVRRGLVLDSWMVSMARYWNSLLFCMMLSLSGVCETWGVDGRADAVRPMGEGN